MAEITSTQVKELREKTNAGMMECKNALVEAKGDMPKAEKILREKGLAAASKKEGRDAKQWLVASYIHMGGKVGVLLQLNCETDFVARTDQFQTLAKNLAMHIAASSPIYVKPDDVPTEILSQEQDIIANQLRNEGKPEAIIQKIMEGKLNKYYEDVCLLKQPFVMDTDKKVEDVIKGAIAEIKENIEVGRFSRFQIG